MNKKLYVGNLPFSAEEGQLQALFGGDGRQVASVRILNDKMTAPDAIATVIDLARLSRSSGNASRLTS